MSDWLKLEAFVRAPVIPDYETIATALLGAGFTVVDDLSLKVYEGEPDVGNPRVR